MAIRTGSLDDAIERRRRERDADGERLIDLRLDFEIPAQNDNEAGRLLMAVGGVWDRRANDFDGEAKSGVVVRIHPGQLRALEWFRSWLVVHAERRDNPPPITQEEIDAFELDTDPDHVYSALFAGGRRAGKTWLATAFAVAYAIMFPGAIVWLVSPNDEKHDEFRRYVADFVAAEWLERETEAGGWELCNGSRLMLKSAYGSGDGLKEGKANLVILNEGQMMKLRAFTVARGAIVDAAGLVLVCANPPVEAKDEQWVSDFAAEAAAGRRAALFLQFNPLDNPHIDRRALLAMRGDLDERTYQIEVLGMFLGPIGSVAYNWNRLENERATPTSSPMRHPLTGDMVILDDVTTEFLVAIEEGQGITAIAGIDFQRFPHIGGPIYKFFGIPERDKVFVWMVDEVVLDGGDEEDWCAVLLDKGYGPETTLIVGDASGRYQHTRRRSADSPPPEWKGRGSFDIIRSCGYRRIVPPSRRMKKNPEILDRARAFTSLIATLSGVRRLFADPLKAPRTCKAIREWKTVHNVPSRTQEAAHLSDGASYPIVRFFPRVLRAVGGSGNPPTVDPVAARVDKTPAIDASAPAVRIMPPTRGPSGMRRGDRGRGM